MKNHADMKKKIAALIGVLLLGGCLSATVLANEEEPSGQKEEKGITASIETDKDTYRAGEEICYTLRIENGRRHWTITAATLTYSHSDGIVPAGEDTMPTQIPIISSGESFELTGRLIGDGEIYVDQENGIGVWVYLLIAAAVAVIAVTAAVVLVRKKKKGSGAALALFLAVSLAAGMVPAIPGEAAASDVEEIVLRPYTTVQYAGQQVTIRAVITLKTAQELVTVSQDHIDRAERVTCHDPSIFRDLDGTYYIVGSFLAGAVSQDLKNWSSMDAEIQGNFTQEVKDQIRAWNLDESAGGWNGYLWAPDIIYNTAMDKYCMYLSANGDNWKSNIVLLTADAFEGPYDYAGTIVYGGFNGEDYAQTDAPLVTGEEQIPERYVTNGVDNHKWGDMFPNCIDPCVFYDDDGNLWMTYGSWSGGIFMLELDEATGLRDYGVSYETNLHSDAYFGKKIAGGAYVSGEASYVQKIGDYYYLFISYGNLEAKGGYNIRVFRSETPDGDYVDALGNDAFYDTYSFNYNTSRGVRLFGGYKWRNFTVGQVAQGHNSAFVDADGRAYVVFHTRTNDGTEGHYVKVHQLFVNREGWLVAAPYLTSGESLPENGLSVQEVAGDYEMIIHELEIDYANLETKKPEFITLAEDGSITGDYTGTWSLEPGTPYITLSFDGVNYSGVTLKMNVENTNIETVVFTAMGTENQVTVWGSRVYDENE